MAKDEMVIWFHQCNEHEFSQTLADSEGQGAWHAMLFGVMKSQTLLND